MADTVFARIIRGEIPARIEHDDDLCLAFHDVAPQAPVHVLVIPKRPLDSLAGVTVDDTALLGHLVVVATQLARRFGLESGYRLVVNCGPDGGQSVDHLHVHLLGGRRLGWPPG
ncbi:MAG: histidine triad nucleotide-binding protein [Planctomycetaceae bacterium]